jgi:hypothetical protein
MNETTQEQTTTAESSAATAHDGHPSRALAFARRHPALTLIGAAGAGLMGGLELAAGVLIGAGVAALVRARDGRATETETEAHAERQRAGRMMEQVEQMAPEVKKRARAVLQAVRGKLEPAATS